MLKEDLDALRPVLYTGASDDGAHAFIFDGYDENDLFHVNWGWAGHADGFFSMDALEPNPGGIGGGGYQFNMEQTAIFGVMPAYTNLSATPGNITVNVDGDTIQFNIYASNSPENCNITCDQSWLTLSSYTAPGSGETTTITLTIDQNTSGETRNATITITQGSFTTTISVTQNDVQYTITVLSENTDQGEVYGGGTFDEGTVIQISADAHDGYEFSWWDDGNTDNPRNITVTENATYIASFAPATGIEENIAPEISIFPNPTSNLLNIISSETISEIEIVNVIGQIVLQMDVNSDNAVCNVSNLSNGMYFIKIYGNENGNIYTKKLTKE